jgi:hypothetical protein
LRTIALDLQNLVQYYQSWTFSSHAVRAVVSRPGWHSRLVTLCHLDHQNQLQVFVSVALLSSCRNSFLVRLIQVSEGRYSAQCSSLRVPQPHTSASKTLHTDIPAFLRSSTTCKHVLLTEQTRQAAAHLVFDAATRTAQILDASGRGVGAVPLRQNPVSQ